MISRDVEVLVIGAGASGIAAGVKLLHRGITDFALLDKGDRIGGTWRDNTYPGCACDVPSALYSFSFAPNPNWSRAFAGQAEIEAYLERTAVRFGVMPHVRLGVTVNDARWDADEQLWRVTTSDGAWTARFLIGAAGPWNEPLIPDLDGLSDFGGEVFHSSRWRHDLDLAGKRIGVVGTGASAVQFVPEIVRDVAELHLFQRTPHWVLPKPDGPLPAAARLALRRIPGAHRALRSAQYLTMETLGYGFRHPWLLRQLQHIGEAWLFATVRDADLRAKLTPDYTLGCKRLLMSNNYYQALTRSNVEVHATALAHLEGNVLVGADGSRAEVDVLIFGTGFHILDMPVAEHVRDADGITLAEHWQGSPQAFLGSTVSGFPNLFLVLGPNLGTGHSSAMMIIEAQVDYAVGAISHVLGTGARSVDVRAQVQDAFNAKVQHALPGTVYNSGGCSSYYLDVNGRNSFSWPWTTGRLRARAGHFNPDDYLVHEPSDDRERAGKSA